MPTIPIMVVNIIEQLRQIRQINIKRHILTQIVDEPSNLALGPKVILDYVAITKVLHVLSCVDKAIQKCRVSSKVLGGTIVTLLECHAVYQERCHEIVDGYSRHLDHTMMEFHNQEAVFFAWIETNPQTT